MRKVKIYLIASIGKNYEIGSRGQLLIHDQEDMKFFRKFTMGYPVIMGRRTWESLPEKLADRRNIVVSSEYILDADDTITDLDQFKKDLPMLVDEFPNGIFIIGGQSIYEQFIGLADEIYLSCFDQEFPEADTWFPRFNESNFDMNVCYVGKDFYVKRYVRKEENDKQITGSTN